MYIQELIIDGFKSYATRTVITGFDSQFNAITGLNGTGKSNILDAICFVLGISNLSQVRVGNLQELVYKQGQAGVTKASVTIVFDNSNPLNSPVGYEQQKQITVTRQVIIGGKNKYMINGHTVQQSQVQNFFHSVQLNVNNPHFLIMQGRITKVLNMKPIEILSMIEEAAGTRMYETKKQSALKTIEKKQQKVLEITKILDENITPRLQQFRQEKVIYHDWSNGNHEIEKLERLCVAFEYREAESKVSNAESYQQEMRDEITHFNNQQKNLQLEVEEISQKLDDVEKKREEEQEGEYQKNKKKEQEISKELVKINTNYQNMKLNLDKESEIYEGLTQQIQQTEVNILEKESELQKKNEIFQNSHTLVMQIQRDLENNQLKYQNACAGVVNKSEIQSNNETITTLSIIEQIGVWESKLRESQSRQQQEMMKRRYNEKKIQELNENCQKEKRNYETENQKLKMLIEDTKEVEKKISKLKYSSEREESLRVRNEELKLQIQELYDQIETITTQIETRLNFEFKDPERGFDRSRVKGLVANLIHVKNMMHCTALEIAAGNKLYQVVVDNEQTGKLLLGKGILKKRVTILPLNKISNRVIEENKLNLAANIAQSKGGTAELALELVGCDEEVMRAMQHVFGGAIICSTSKIAESITFDPAIRCRTITFDGDTFDPSGTITGGSRNQIGALLMKMSEMSELKFRYDELFQQNQQIEEELSRLDQVGKQHSQLQQTLQMKSHEIQLLQERMNSSTYNQLCQEIETVQREIQLFDEEISPSLLQLEQQARDELEKLKDSSTASNVQSQRAQTLKGMESQLKSLQKQLNVKKNEEIHQQSECNGLVIEIQTLQTELNTLRDSLKSSDHTKSKYAADLDKLELQLQNKREEYEKIKKELATLTSNFNKYNSEMKTLSHEKEMKLKEIQNLSLECRKLTHKLECWKKDIHVAQRRVHELEDNYSWIESNKQYFGLARSDFDFTGLDLKECQEKLHELKSTQEKLSKKVNKKVMGMIDKAEAESEELLRKKEVILKDKEKIESVIEELDIKKIQSIQNTWVRVNKDFGSIFSTLLPGTLAKLDIPEGCTVMDGLEVKVSFNGVWKESLTELSGGQRSLLALSLILALLLFKPAPMYILDEVDAALDLSHTQNIGLMLRTHFSSSQFIVVSLKEGMFNNANVIFRTKFIDGISTVLRTVAGGKSGSNNKLLTATSGAGHHPHRNNKHKEDEENEEEEESSSPLKKKGKSNNNKKKRNEEAENMIDL